MEIDIQLLEAFWQDLITTTPQWVWIVAAMATACILLQWYVYLRHFSRVSRYKMKPLEGSKNFQPPISVVVCVHNRKEQTAQLVEALSKQIYPRFEIILVDDRSIDEIAYWIQELPKEYPMVKVTRIDEPHSPINPKKYALTIGIKATSKEMQFDSGDNYIVFTDNDCIPASPNWLAHMAEGFKNGKKIVLGYSPYKAKRGLLNALYRFESMFTGLQYLGLALAGKPFMGVGRNLAYTRKLFFDFKGFYKHTGITGGDDDLFVNRTATAQNTSVVIHPDAYMWSEPKTTWSEWLRQKRRHYSVGRYYKWRTRWRLGFLSGAYILTFPLLTVLLFTPVWYLAPVLWFLRAIVVVPIQWIAQKKLQTGLSFLTLLLVDALYAGIHFVFGIASLRRLKGW